MEEPRRSHGRTETSLQEWLAGIDADAEDDDLPDDLRLGPVDPPGGPHDVLAGDDAHLDEAPPRRRGRVWAAAALAWALCAGVALVALWPDRPGTPPAGGPDMRAAGGPGPATPAAVLGTPAAGAAGRGTSAGGTGVDGSGAGATAAAGAGAGAGGSVAGAGGAAGAVAALAVRLSETEQDAEGRVRYVDLAVPERVDWLGDVAVVTVAAVVVEGGPAGWDAPRPARYAQPVLAAGGDPPRALGRPWPLPAPAGEPEAPALEPLDDARATSAAGERLAAAGYADVEVERLSRLAGTPGVLVATVSARAPGEAAPAVRDVWLTARGDLPVEVLGTGPPDTDATAPP